MLTLEKIRRISGRKVAVGVFMIGVIAGVGVPLIGGAGAGSVSAAANTKTQNAVAATDGAAVTYSYGQISMSDAYPLYITASFTAAGGLFLYALTYIPVRAKARARSQYASRVATWAKTTY